MLSMMRDVLAIWRQEANPLTRKALERLPKLHFFAAWHSRFKLLLVQKMIYWIFKLRNRLEVHGFEHVRREMENGGPFLLVVNHSGNLDVIMQQSIHAHHDNLVFTFINSEGFYIPEVPNLAVVLHYAEQIPRRGPGQKSVDRVVQRLVHGDRVLFFPEGSYDFGIVWDGFTGVARIAHGFWHRTGKKLRIVPACTIGMHEAYNPHVHHHHHRHNKHHVHPVRASYWFPKLALIRRPTQKVIVKFGPAFTVDVPETPTANDLKAATTTIMQTIAGLWGQKHLRPNLSHAWINNRVPIVDGKRVYGG